MKKILITFLLLLFTCPFFAQIKAEKVDLIEMVKELIITKKTDTNIKQVWWIPIEYWDVALNDSKYSNQEIQNQLKEILTDYTIVSVVDVEIMLFGGLKSNDITISFSNINGDVLLPLENNEKNENIFQVLEVIKPTMKNMLGQFGEKMNFYVFNNTDAQGNKLTGPYQKGEITIRVNNEDFNYKLPLGSLVEKKILPY